MEHARLLGVPAHASTSEIQKAFRSAAMEIHPDHSNSPEAAEAFARIKEARDELLRRAEAAGPARDAATTAHATAAAIKATDSATYAQYVYSSLPDDMSEEEIAHIQMLDSLVQKSNKRSLFRLTKESDEVRRHRKKIATNNNRIMGKY